MSATTADKPATNDANSTPTKEQQKAPAALEEDDEFEDFPAEGTSRYI
jgi:hypothetical protein